MPRVWSQGSKTKLNKDNNLETQSDRDRGEPRSQRPKSDSPQMGEHGVRNKTALEKPGWDEKKM